MTRIRVVGRVATVARHAGGLIMLAVLLSACGEDMSPKPEPANQPNTTGKRRVDPNAQSLFGDSGVSLGNISSRNKNLFGQGDDEKARLPVNKYLWQAALDTLSFLPLASSDPFTGVIATDWATNLRAPDERLKVTAFITSAALSAASLKVAVYREVKNEDGAWVAAPVSPDTARKLEDAILSRAREIRIAEREGETAG